MPFQTRTSATLAPDRIIKLLIPSMDIWHPPPANPTAETGSGGQGINVRYPWLIHISTYPYISRYECEDIQDLSAYLLIQSISIGYPRLIHISTYPDISRHEEDIQNLSTYPHIQWISIWISHGYMDIWISIWISHGYLMDILWISLWISFLDKYPCFLDM